MGLSGRGSMKGRKIQPFCCCVLFRELSCGGVRGGDFDSKSEWLKVYFESSSIPCENDLFKGKHWYGQGNSGRKREESGGFSGHLCCDQNECMHKVA